MKNKVAIHLAEGFEEIEAVSIIDVLRRASIEIITVSITDKYDIIGAHNITIKADKLYKEIDYSEIDMIILPGGMPGTNNLNSHAGLKNQIINFHNQRKYLAAICAAPLILGNLNILKNKKATCYPGFEDQLLGAEPSNADVEISENIVTGKGPGVAIKFALKIVEILKGEKIANSLSKNMIVI